MKKLAISITFLAASLLSITTAFAYSISGRVSCSGTAVSGVNVSIKGPINTTVTTNENGNYSKSRLNAGTYQLTPSRAGYYFTPTVGNLALSNSDLTQDFSAAEIDWVKAKLYSGLVAFHQSLYNTQEYKLVGNVSADATNNPVVKINGIVKDYSADWKREDILPLSSGGLLQIEPIDENEATEYMSFNGLGTATANGTTNTVFSINGRPRLGSTLSRHTDGAKVYVSNYYQNIPFGFSNQPCVLNKSSFLSYSYGAYAVVSALLNNDWDTGKDYIRQMADKYKNCVDSNGNKYFPMRMSYKCGANLCSWEPGGQDPNAVEFLMLYCSTFLHLYKEHASSEEFAAFKEASAIYLAMLSID